jgi:hypothetical protein
LRSALFSWRVQNGPICSISIGAAQMAVLQLSHQHALT